jgi:carboxyl-terminal processing protease
MPERAGKPSLVLGRPDFENFANAVIAATETRDEQTLVPAISRAALEGGFKTLDPRADYVDLRENTNAPASARWRVEGQVGVITVAELKDGTTMSVSRALRSIKKAVGAPNGYILDLRNNPGGLLSEAQRLADLFLDGGRIGTVIVGDTCLAPVFAGNSRDEVIDARPGDETDAAPLIILINAKTANGAVLIASALSENHRARIVGDPSAPGEFVDAIVPLTKRSALRIPTGSLVGPTGKSLVAGVVPTIVSTPAESDDPLLGYAMRILAQ